MGHIGLIGSNVANHLLLDVAERIQLAPSDYAIARQHYEALSSYLNSNGNPFNGLVRNIYPQGSVAIGAVIASKFETDEFDVDAVVELGIHSSTPPEQVLNGLFNAIKGQPGSRYYKKVTRRTRCVTVDFDNMHVDLTPAVYIGPDHRVSRIFHAHENEPSHLHYHVTANPLGFAEWFKVQMPAAQLVMDSVLKANTEPLPTKTALNQKSLPLVALQLIKRWRNKCYENRDGVRRPPSVILSFFAGNSAWKRETLLAELSAQVDALLQYFAAADAREELVDIHNPKCWDDVFSDRWPENQTEQKRFTSDLKNFAAALAKLEASPSLPDCRTIMSQLFGERPTQMAFDAFTERYSSAAKSNNLRQYVGSGSIALGASGIGSTATTHSVFAAPRSTNFGSE